MYMFGIVRARIVSILVYVLGILLWINKEGAWLTVVPKGP